MEPLIQSLDMARHLIEGREPTKEITKDDGKVESNPNYTLWAKNDAIKKPVNETKKVFQLARGLGQRYQDFQTAMLTKPPYPTYL
ncbi:hypothetical protein KY284_010658 [Solanum tuberosum]|nr:hypothetical protein KY284_010658 [Solanum tuberosum]